VIVASIGARAEHGFQVFIDWVPRFAGAVGILVLGYIVARVVSGLVSRGLHRVGLDRTLHSGHGGQMIQRVVGRPSGLLGTIAFWAIVLGTISLAASVLGIAALTSFVGAIWSYLPNVIAALLIFVVAGAISAAVAGLASRTMGDTGLGKIVATAAPILIMAIASFMILDQLKIAHNIVVITYAALLGAIALGCAIAFGLGGREVAGQMLQGVYAKGLDEKDQWKQDMDTGISRARDGASGLQERAAGY
jgi:hypothetical protein